MDDDDELHLPDNVLDIVLSHIHSISDRAAFRSVCRRWASVWRHQWPRTPPIMSWLAAPCHCVALSDATIHRVPLPAGIDGDIDVNGAVCRGSFGNWIALVPAQPRKYWEPCFDVSPLLVNPFSGASVWLPILTPAVVAGGEGGGGGIDIRKIVMSAPPDSDGCVVVAIVNRFMRKIAIWRPGQESWSAPAAAPRHVEDAVFYDGELYSIDECSQIYVFSTDDYGDELNPMRLEMDLMGSNQYAVVARVLVECEGRLLLVDRHRHDYGEGYQKYGVYALERDAACGILCWSLVRRLDGHVLFLGDGCCRALPVTERDKVKGGPIVFLDDKAKITAVVAVDDRKPLERSVLIRRRMGMPASHVLDAFRQRGGGGGGGSGPAGRRNQCFGFGGLEDFIGWMKSFISLKNRQIIHMTTW